MIYDERAAPLTLVEDSEGVIRTQSGIVLPNGVTYRHTSDDTHDPVKWRAHVKVEKRWADGDDPSKWPLYEIVEAEHNLLMTVGATQLWTALSTAGLGTPWNTTNAQLVVGDGSTGPAAGNTDMAAALATKINAADATSATNATPIVVTATFSPTPLVGEVYACSGFSGAGGASINQTFELSVASAAACTLLNSAGGGAITLTGGVLQKVNKYRQQANGAGSAVVTTNAIVYVAVFATANANFAWNEWGTTIGAAATNKQAAPPTTLFNRATPGGGLGTKTSAAAWTLTTTLSLA